MGEEYYYAKDYTKALKWVLYECYFCAFIFLILNAYTYIHRIVLEISFKAFLVLEMVWE